jgi:hypothetical protein
MKAMIAGLLMAVFGASSAPATAADQDPLPAIPRSRGVYELKLAGRSACVVPRHRGQSRAEGGQIDVTSPSSNALAAVLSGSVAANAYLGYPGSAAERFQLVQAFEITCSDKNVKSAKLSLDSVLAGFVRSKHRADTGVRLAIARVCPIDSPQPVMVITHPPLAVQGRYSVTAEFVLEAEAFGIADAHANADFSPSGSLPSDWVRSRDPFQGVDKKDFGFSLTLTVAADDSTAITERRNRTSDVRQTAVIMPSQKAAAPRQISINEKGFGRLPKP